MINIKHRGCDTQDYSSVLHVHHIQYSPRHNVTGVGAVPGAPSDAPFYEGHHGRPVDPSNLGCLIISTSKTPKLNMSILGE